MSEVSLNYGSYQRPPLDLLNGSVPIFCSTQFQNCTMELPCAIGTTEDKETFMFDLTKAHHLLVAGATGQGKTACLNAIICSLLLKKAPSEVQFILVDPKRCEFDIYAPLKKLFLQELVSGVPFDYEYCLGVIDSLRSLMEHRYYRLKDSNVRHITEYNQKHPDDPMQYVVTVIDEYSDLLIVLGRDFETKLTHLASISWRFGIHFVICTQRPTTNIITGWIKANFPARIAFRVSDRFDSKVIIDRAGAECLNSEGDMLIITDSLDPVHIQGAYIEDKVIERIVSFIAQQNKYDCSKTSNITTCTE